MNEEIKTVSYYKLENFFKGHTLYIKVEGGNDYYTRFDNDLSWFYSTEKFSAFRNKMIEMTPKEVFLEIL